MGGADNGRPRSGRLLQEGPPRSPSPPGARPRLLSVRKLHGGGARPGKCVRPNRGAGRIVACARVCLSVSVYLCVSVCPARRSRAWGSGPTRRPQSHPLAQLSSLLPFSPACCGGGGWLVVVVAGGLSHVPPNEMSRPRLVCTFKLISFS